MGRPERRAHRALPQRDLYVVAMAVADYDRDDLDLRYPVHDAEGLVQRLAGQNGTLYDAVHVATLIDAQVTSGQVRKLRHEFLRKARHEDTIVVFAAGHGVRTEDGENYFLTPEATPEEPYEGIDRGTIESLVTWSKLYAKRRLLLLDTCHAGTDLSGTRSGVRGVGLLDEKAMDALVDATGAGLYILAASTDDGFAREQEGNGLFTRALLEGLDGAADADGDGLVEVQELVAHTSRLVHERSAGRQHPTVPRVEGGEDFPLASVP